MSSRMPRPGDPVCGRGSSTCRGTTDGVPTARRAFRCRDIARALSIAVRTTLDTPADIAEPGGSLALRRGQSAWTTLARSCSTCHQLGGRRERVEDRLLGREHQLEVVDGVPARERNRGVVRAPLRSRTAARPAAGLRSLDHEGLRRSERAPRGHPPQSLPTPPPRRRSTPRRRCRGRPWRCPRRCGESRSPSTGASTIRCSPRRPRCR